MEVLHQLLEPVAFHGVGDISIVDEGIRRPEHLDIGGWMIPIRMLMARNALISSSVVSCHQRSVGKSGCAIFKSK
ncbi:hypothetical protein DPMN_018525 [Dreissena polymorpha]|uniref:Uncharacterized protein n=1 Tax=Dreissena polymorpha TaxID=45954 RepID=A0A9D4NIJ9_DREPO|nr:hypothetical protein DPMN_018525 [Dreissena polymorpha]